MTGTGSRALVIGEALVDVVGGRAHPGGSPLNVAVGLARLGIGTTLHSRFGRDAHGELVRAHLEASGVRITPGSQDARPTSVAEAVLAPDGSASYRFDVDWSPAPAPSVPDEYAAIHVGSIACFLEPGADVVEAAFGAARGAFRSFDPNIRPALVGDREAARARAERLVGLAHLVKASDEDLAWLYPDEPLRSVLDRWAALGPAAVVVTRGAAGAEAVSGDRHVRVEAVPVRVADTIGAGDSFMAGLLAAVDEPGLLDAEEGERRRGIDPDSLRDAVGFAARCAALTVSRVGADPPTRAELRP